MTSPILSIIIPHSSTTIENDPLLPTIASIVDQEGASIELLLEHGGGIPGLWGKLSHLLNLSAKKDQITLRVIEEKSSSAEEALATGIKRATGTWIGFLKPGEQFLPGALTALQSALAANPEIDLFLMGSVTSIAKKIVIMPAVLPTRPYLTSITPAWPSHSFFCRATLLRDDVILEPRYQHQMITEWLLRLLSSEKKVKALPFFTTFAPNEEEKKESLLPNPTGMFALLKSWHQWRHQATRHQAEKMASPPSPILIYQNGSLNLRRSLS